MPEPVTRPRFPYVVALASGGGSLAACSQAPAPPPATSASAAAGGTSNAASTLPGGVDGVVDMLNRLNALGLRVN